MSIRYNLGPINMHSLGIVFVYVLKKILNILLLMFNNNLLLTRIDCMVLMVDKLKKIK